MSQTNYTTPVDLLEGLVKDMADLVAYRQHVLTIQAGGEVPNLTLHGAELTVAGLEACIENKQTILARLAEIAEASKVVELHPRPERERGVEDEIRATVAELEEATADLEEAVVELEVEATKGILEREKEASARAGKLAVAEAVGVKAEVRARVGVKAAAGKVVSVEVEAGQFVEVTPRRSIRLHGLDRNRVNGPVAYDRTFEIGDSAEYDSYNTSFIGQIVAIGAKTVTIEAHGGRRRLKLAEFSWRNRHFDLEKVAARNANERYYI